MLSASTPTLTDAFAIPDDPLRDGKVSDSTAVPDFHAERERDARKSKKTTVPDETPSESTDATTPDATSYYEEY